MMTKIEPNYADGAVTLYAGDCLAVLSMLPDNSVDAVVTDPPAGISFMGRRWDHHKGGREQWAAWLTEVMREAYRVAKPGAHAFVWALPRTSHWTAIGIEDAGWEIRDRVVHLFGTGFPKSLNLPGGLGTALKPAAEDWWLARKPLTGTVAANVLAHGTGALNIDGCRIEGEVPSVPRGTFAGSNNNWEMAGRNGTMSEPHPAGRWPANVTLDETAAAALDHMSGELASHDTTPGGQWTGTMHNGSTYNLPGSMETKRPTGRGDTGGASRFFYTAKAGSDERITHDGISHPTVKPLSLMRWLVRLVTPPGGVILEPFAGSGTTVEAAILEGFRCIAIEREADYLPLITQRLNRRRNPVAYLTAAGEDLGLFDEEQP